MGEHVLRTTASVRKATWGTTVGNRFVRMAALMEEGVWPPTNACVPTASPGLSVREITAPGRASPRCTTRCARASSQALCAQRLCAAPQWDGRGVTPARCALPSLTPVEEGSYQITAPGRAKMWMSARPSLASVKEETVSTQWDPLNVNAPLGTSSTRSHRNVMIWTSVQTSKVFVV